MNTTNDLNWTNSEAMDTVGEGDKLRFTADVGEHNSDQCILFLDPVATETR